LSQSFHGRDLFAPVAARLALGSDIRWLAEPMALPRAAWPDDWAAVIYVDAFGNAMCGLRGASLPADAALAVAGRRLLRAERFADRPPGAPFWHVNANGLVEIAENQGSAAARLRLSIGQEIAVLPA